MLIIAAKLLDTVKEHGRLSYPFEGCGLLLGCSENGRNMVTAVKPLSNVWPVEEEKRTRFRIAADDWRDVEIEALLNDLDIVGIFHSHPDHPPLASPRDLAWAAWPGYSYLITEISAGKPGATRSWQLKDDRSGFIEEQMIEEERTEMNQ